MTDSAEIHNDKSLTLHKDLEKPSSPHGLPGFQIPSPIITKRTRTFSASERAASMPVVTGKIKYFCRQKGHGFVSPDKGGEDLFVHISDIDGEYVPQTGDDVTYRLCHVPIKKDVYQATHVVITHLAPGTRHERWEDPPQPEKHP